MADPSTKKEKDWKNANPVGNFIMRGILGGVFGGFIYYFVIQGFLSKEEMEKLNAHLPWEGFEVVVAFAIITMVVPKVTNTIANSQLLGWMTRNAIRRR